jgi:hypothetical protein
VQSIRSQRNLTGVINCHCSDAAAGTETFCLAVALLKDFRSQGASSSGMSPRARPGGFLPDCGSSIFKDNKDGEKIVLSVGALNPPTGLKHLKDIFTESKGDWYELQPR